LNPALKIVKAVVVLCIAFIEGICEKILLNSKLNITEVINTINILQVK
jgi:hypothetical protein